jgi:hypothetical protein
MKATDLFVWGFVLHIVADWFLQNEWMATYKTSLRHPAAWVHSGIHFAAMLFVFPVWAALLIGVTHLLIDTRAPLQMWRRFYRQTTDGPVMLTFGMWQDQAAHIAVLGAVALLVDRL